VAKFLTGRIWNNAAELSVLKHWLDFGNLLMLLAIAGFGILIVFRLVSEKRKRVLEIIEAVLAPLLIFTSVYLSPVLGDQIGNLRHAPRTITASEKAIFIRALEGAKRGPVLVRTNELDNETQSYVSDIRALLDGAGYNGDAVTEMGGRLISDSSVSLVIKDLKTAPNYLLSIQKAFKRIDIDALCIIPKEEVHWLKDGDVIVFVHKKPE
jgi:hypothetical protein